MTIREDRALYADLGVRANVTNLLLCYNPIWLLMGLETLYSEQIHIAKADTMTSTLSKFINKVTPHIIFSNFLITCLCILLCSASYSMRASRRSLLRQCRACTSPASRRRSIGSRWNALCASYGLWTAPRSRTCSRRIPVCSPGYVFVLVFVHGLVTVTSTICRVLLVYAYALRTLQM